MNKTLTISTVALAVLSMFLIVKVHELKVKQKDLSNTVVIHKADTSYSKKPFTPTTEYKFIQIPKVVVYQSEHIKVDTVYVDSDNIQYESSIGSFKFNHQFLLQYPENPKLLQLLTGKNTLEVTLLDPSGLIHTDKFTNFYPEVNFYNYQNGSLSYKPKPFLQRFKISGEMMVRPLVNMYDVNLSLKYNTRKTYYEIGLNSYYYPQVIQRVGVTPYFRLGLTL